MKILVYNHQDQYALSRKDIEIISTIIPKEYFLPIKEFHFVNRTNDFDRFEYDYETKVASFEYIVKQRTSQTTEDALRHLLIGLKRIKSKANFKHVIKKNEVEEYSEFVDSWLPECVKSISQR